MAKKKAYAAAISLALVCALITTCLLRRPPAGNAVNIDGLVDQLKASAEKKLAAPSLANEHLNLSAPSARLEVRAKEVIDAAIHAGGTAIKTTADDGTLTVLVQVPQRNAGMFYADLGEERASRVSDEHGTTRLIDVSIRPE